MALNKSDLAEAIGAAFEKEWLVAKNIPLPAAGMEDRKMLFAAIARGILDYLKAHENEIIKSMTLERPPGEPTDYLVKGVELDISAGA